MREACQAPPFTGKNRTCRISSRLRFTLIELLITIAIIAILAGVLLPALNAAREKGRAAVCIGNIRQINTAAVSYAGDFNDHLPPQNNVIINNVTHPTIRNKLYLYMDGKEFSSSQKGAWFCPSYPVVPPQEGRMFYASYSPICTYGKLNSHWCGGSDSAEEHNTYAYTARLSKLRPDSYLLTNRKCAPGALLKNGQPESTGTYGEVRVYCIRATTMENLMNPFNEDTGAVGQVFVHQNRAPFLLANGGVITRIIGKLLQPTWSANQGWLADFK